MRLNEKVVETLQALLAFIRSRILSHSIYLGVSFCLGYSLVDSVSLIDLDPILDTLKNISAAVFTLAGIWIAYSYPQAISAYTSPNSVRIIPTDETKRIENLVLIVLTSAFVISSLLIMNILNLLVYGQINHVTIRYLLKLSGISYIIYLSFLQLKAIFVVMITNISFVNELHHKKTEREANNDL